MLSTHKPRVILPALTAVLFVWAGMCAAWPGFDWDTWLSITGVTAPDIASPQAGNPEPAPLLTEHPEHAPTLAQWAARREGIVAVLSALLGEASELQRDESPTRPGHTIQEEGYTRTHVLIPGERDEPVPAYQLAPESPIAAPTPVMIVLHQTHGRGKDEPCGLSGDPEMAFAVELARRGYICIVPDVIGFGERIPSGTEPYHNAHDFYRRHPQWSCFGKMNWDLSRVIDYIETLAGADPGRVGVIGHSHGAYGAIMAAVFEPRISLVIASCGFTMLRADPRPYRWSHLTPLMPRLGFYRDAIDEAPFDWHEIMACIAPRPYFNWATLNDTIFPETDNLAESYRQVREVYALYEAAQNFEGRLEPGPHVFPEHAREQAYTWLDAQFQR